MGIYYPFVMLAIALIGSWLLGPKSATQKADSMPQINSAVRGSAVFVTFGSNRVSAQVVWTKNFKAVRQKGGGKGGGSGGFGSAKGGGGGTGYLYYWDMMFNFGIVDQASVFRRGWVGADPLNYSSLDAITAGGTTAVQGAFPIYSADPSKEQASLTFTEAFFAPGYPTGDVGLESWTYFQAQEGVACQWPNTCWVGFNHLELGQSPSVPQLSFELVPISSVGLGTFLHAAPGFLAQVSIDAFGGSSTGTPGNTLGIVSGDDGNHYAFIMGNIVGDCHILCIETGETRSLDHTDFLGATGIDTAPSCFPCPGTPFFFLYAVTAINTTGGWLVGAARMRIGDINNISVDDSRQMVRSGLNGLFGTEDQKSSTVLYDPLTMQPTMVKVFIDTFWTHNTVLTFMLNGDLRPDITSTDWYHCLSSMGIADNFWDFAYLNPNHSNEDHLGAVLSDNTVLTWIGQSDYDYIDANRSGHLSWAPITGPGMYLIGGAALNVSTTFNITDYATHFDGSPSTNTQDDYANPTAIYFGSKCYVTMARGYQLAADLAAAQGCLCTSRIYTYDQSTATATLVDRQSFAHLVDPIVDLGGPSDTFAPPNYHLTWTDGVLYAVATGTNSWVYASLYGLEELGTGYDVPPPYIIYRILTSEVFGFATQALFGYTITTDRIDSESYLNAVSWCQSQGIKVSVTYNNQEDLLTVLNELLALYGGYLVEQGGKIKFGIVRDTDTPVRVIDNHHLIPPSKGKPPVQVTKGALEDGYNKVQFNYLDRAIEYKQNQVEVSDEVDIDMNGPRVKTFQARYVMNGSCAMNIALRALWANLYAKDQYAFKLGYKDADLCPGDCITLVDSFDQILKQGMKARIVKWEEKERGKFDVVAVREFPYIITASAAFTSQTSIDAGYGGLISPTSPMMRQVAYELPQEFQGSQPVCFFGYNQGSQIMGAKLYISNDGQSYVEAGDQQPFVVGGISATNLPLRPKGFVENGFEFYLFPTSGFNTTTPTFIDSYTYDDFTPSVRAAGASIFIVGSEAVAMEGLTLLGVNHYRAKYAYRGWGGSPIGTHNSGDLFHHHAAGIFSYNITADMIGTRISYKIAPYNFAGQVYPISSIDASTYTIRGDYFLPRQQPITQMYVQSAQAWPASVPITGPYIGVFSGDGVNPAGSDLILTWPNAYNDNGYGAGGMGAGTYGHNGTLPDTQWRVEISSKNGTLVSSHVVTTGYFAYTLAQNSTEFSGFAKDLIVRVVPFNTKGDGPVDDVRSISMNW